MKLTISALVLLLGLPAAAAGQQLDVRFGGGIHLGSPRVSLARAPALTAGATFWMTRSVGVEVGGSRSWTEWEVFDSARVGYRNATGSITQADVRAVVVVARETPLDAQFGVGIGQVRYAGEAYREEVSVQKLSVGLELSYPLSPATRFIVLADYAGYRPYREYWRDSQRDVLIGVGLRARLLPLRPPTS